MPLGGCSNAVLQRKIAHLLEQARVLCCLTGEKARLFDDVYYAAGTWSCCGYLFGSCSG
jgi:hypothetical protein